MEDDLGIIIKTLRKNQQMTLNDLANKTGVSISFLSQLERGKSSATLESLKNISQALNVEPGYFFNGLSKKKDLIQQDTLKKKHKIHYESLYDSMENPAFFPHLVILDPYQNKGNLIKHPGQEFLYVIEGQLTVQVDDKTYILDPSDSIMFDSNNEHYWYNYTNQAVKFLSVNYANS